MNRLHRNNVDLTERVYLNVQKRFFNNRPKLIHQTDLSVSLKAIMCQTTILKRPLHCLFTQKNIFRDKSLSFTEHRKNPRDVIFMPKKKLESFTYKQT